MNINSITRTAAVVLADEVRQLESIGRNVIKLQTGEPDFQTFSGIGLAANNALKSGETHYTYSNGMPCLRSAIANSLNSSALEIDPECVLVTHGAVGAIGAAFMAIIEYGDEIIIPEPNWPTVDSIVKLCGGKPVKVALEDLLYKDPVETLDRILTKKTKAIYINTPVNPTGAVISQPILDAICHWASLHNLYIIADEVYRSLQFVENKTSTLLCLGKFERYIFVDSFSKKYAMTGWRIGYCISSSATLKLISKAAQVSFTCIAPFVQLAALHAVSENDSLAYCSEMHSIYSMRRHEAISLCRQLGLSVAPADGAFYLFIRLPDCVSDVSFSKELLDKYQVCVVPGSAFGNSGAGHIRITYAQDLREVLAGIRAIGMALSGLRSDKGEDGTNNRVKALSKVSKKVKLIN